MATGPGLFPMHFPGQLGAEGAGELRGTCRDRALCPPGSPRTSPSCHSPPCPGWGGPLGLSTEHKVTPRHCSPTAGVPCLPLIPLLRIANLTTPSNGSAWRSLPTQQGHLGAPLGSSTEDSMEKVRHPPPTPASGSGQSLNPLHGCLLPQGPVIPSQPGHWSVLRAGDTVWLLSCPLHIAVAPRSRGRL